MKTTKKIWNAWISYLLIYYTSIWDSSTLCCLTDRSASYLDLHLEIDNEGRLRTKLYDKRDDFNFPIVFFPVICSNIPAAPAYGVYISQLIRYSRACGSYQGLLDRVLLLTRKQLNQGFLLAKLKPSFRTFYGRHHDLVDRYGISVSKWPRICSTCRNRFPVLSSFMTYHPVFSGVHVTRSLVLYVCFVLLYTDFDYPFGICKLFLKIWMSVLIYTYI